MNRPFQLEAETSLGPPSNIPTQSNGLVRDISKTSSHTKALLYEWSEHERSERAIPSYLREVYSWAYLNPCNARLLDCEAVVATLLWGNNSRLRRALLAEIGAGERVLQAAHVYGRLIPDVARVVGLAGHLDVIDVVPLQVALCRLKLRPFSNARARVGDATQPGDPIYDTVSCFFLLHEIPDELKRAVVDALLSRLAPGGKAVFIDYHKPHWSHPLKGITSLVFDSLEPFAKGLWQKEISQFASGSGEFVWNKETYFAGLFQKVVARRTAEPSSWK